MDALSLGVASWRLGAGRERKEDAVQFGAGITLHAQVGQRIDAGAPLLSLHTDEPQRFDRAMESLAGAISIDDSTPSERKIVLERITRS